MPQSICDYSSTRVRVLLLAEVRLYREGLASILASDRRLHLVGAAPCSSMDVPDALCAHPDVLLIDAAGLRADGGPCSHLAKANAKIVAFGIVDSIAQALSCVEAGAAALVMGTATAAELIEVVLSVHKGAYCCPSTVLPALFQRVALRTHTSAPEHQAALTKREQGIMTLLDHGMSNKEIARALSIGVSTVKSHVHHILGKLNASRRTAAANLYKQKAASLPVDGDQI